MKLLRTSIIVLCYNGLEEATRPCLESIVANTLADSYELILVDNASSDGTPDYLRTFAAEHSNVLLQLNAKNKGYAGGNNDGMHIASGEYIVLLNNDTLVPAGWLEGLLKLLKDNSSIGLVGPVTNSAGNEQRIELPGLNETNFDKIANEYIARQQGIWFPTDRLGFFCVAMRKEVIDRIGYLDERFGLGMFEDDDYCIRAKQAGYSLAVVEDCFVFHKGSVSFNKLAVETYRALFEKNKVLFNQKHGMPWSFTEITFGYWEKINRDLAALQTDLKIQEPALERILLRWENLRHLLIQVHKAELQGQNGGAVTASAIMVRAKWQTRWFNFKRNVIHGSWRERYRYLHYLAGRLRVRVSGADKRFELHPEIRNLLANLPQAGGRKVVIFPATVDYAYMHQRPQNLAEAFADAGYLVIYGTLNHIADKVQVAEKVRDNLYLVNESQFIHLVHVYKPEETIYYCLWPNNIKHLEYLPYSNLIYDYMDELSLLDLPAHDLERDHLALLNRADLVTVSAGNLMDNLPERIRPKTLLINNAVSRDFINAVDNCVRVADEMAVLKDHPILGYYGAIAEWMDFDLIERMAEVFPDARIVLIGPVAEKIEKRVENILRKHTNVIVYPPRKQLELIPFLKCFDVCIIPFLKNAVTDAVSPVKLFEYFSAGKSVVTTDLVECVKYPPVLIANNHEQFISIVRKLASNKAVELNLEAQNIALQNTWDHRVQEIRSRMKTKDKTL